MQVMPIRPVQAVQSIKQNMPQPRLATKHAESKEDVLEAFDAFDRFFDRAWPWVVGGAVVYIVAQIVRWWLGR